MKCSLFVSCSCEHTTRYYRHGEKVAAITAKAISNAYISLIFKPQKPTNMYKVLFYKHSKAQLIREEGLKAKRFKNNDRKPKYMQFN